MCEKTDRLAEIEERAKKATNPSTRPYSAIGYELFRLAHKDIPWLVAEVRRLRADREMAIEYIEAIRGQKGKGNSGWNMAELADEAFAELREDVGEDK